MKRGTTEHPKLLHLCSILNIQKFEAVGILEMLWHFTAKFAPQGDIGKYSDAAIAKAVGWKRPTGTKGVTPECRLSEALVEAKWLDSDPVHRLIVHDWEDHADQLVTRYLSRQKLDFVKPKASLPLPLPEPIPVPEPTPTAARVQPIRAADLNGQTPQRFAEWWVKYPLQDDRDSAARMYLGVVTAETEAAALACLDRYLLSDRVARGIVLPAWKWLEQQHRNNWTGDWPKVRDPPKSRQQLSAEEWDHI